MEFTTDYYPAKEDGEKVDKSNNAAIKIYGNRFISDQTIYEYLIEFLLVFVAAKTKDGQGIMKFHDEDKTEYYVRPRMGFRRFVFYERAKKLKNIKVDEEAYKEIRKILKNKLQMPREEDKENFLKTIQDLFYGYSAILKKRSWSAQALLPLCPEMILCEEMPNIKERIKGPEESFEKSVDSNSNYYWTFSETKFTNDNHSFLARGGELYYLHLLQILDEKPDKKEKLEKLLVHLLTNDSLRFSELVDWIQGTWEQEAHIDRKCLVEKKNMGYFPKGCYLQDGIFAVDELISYLSNNINPIKRIELLSRGVMLQILRMLADRTAEYLEIPRQPWIVDMKSKRCGTIIRKLSMNSFNNVCDNFTTAINRVVAKLTEDDPDSAQIYKLYKLAKKESLDLFKSKGKELKCVIPSKGPYERFSLSEDLTRFLVLSLVKPKQKMDLDTFLDKLYTNYGIVIGPNEFKKSNAKENISSELTEMFNYNRDAFQEFLKSTGFLRDLSDATSIVVNPYDEVDLL